MLIAHKYGITVCSQEQLLRGKCQTNLSSMPDKMVDRSGLSHRSNSWCAPSPPPRNTQRIRCRYIFLKQTEFKRNSVLLWIIDFEIESQTLLRKLTTFQRNSDFSKIGENWMGGIYKVDIWNSKPVGPLRVYRLVPELIRQGCASA